MEGSHYTFSPSGISIIINPLLSTVISPSGRPIARLVPVLCTLPRLSLLSYGCHSAMFSLFCRTYRTSRLSGNRFTPTARFPRVFPYCRGASYETYDFAQVPILRASSQHVSVRLCYPTGSVVHCRFCSLGTSISIPACLKGISSIINLIPSTVILPCGIARLH